MTMPEILACPTCKRPVVIEPANQRPASFPFCSSRCRLRDLGAWADGSRVIPGDPVGSDGTGMDVDLP